MKYRKISIIIPLYNEQRFINDLIKKVAKADVLGLEKEIIIVNDGSTDKSRNIMTEQRKNYPNIKLVHLTRNQGKGKAVKEGIKRASGQLILIQDADLEYDPQNYKQLIKPFEDNELAVYGSRTLGIKVYKNNYSSLIYYLGGRVLTWYINMLFGLNLTDQPTGYKIIESSLFKRITANSSRNDFSFEVEISALLSGFGVKIKEVPIIYKPRSKQDGKKIKFSDFFKAVYVGFYYKFIRNPFLAGIRKERSKTYSIL